MDKYFTISEFAKLRNININSLRYYEKIGVLRPYHVDERTGYRYYSPEQVPILDVILLCINFGMPLKELKNYINSDDMINNKELFETGKRIAKERICDFQMELSKIEYTLQYLNNNQQYSEEKGFYKRNIPERTVITLDYTGSLSDIRKIEIESGKLYNYAQSKKYSPVFPAGLLISQNKGEIKTKIFFEIVRKNVDDKNVVMIPAGEFRCNHVNLTPEIDLRNIINSTYGTEIQGDIIISNMLLEKFQIGTKKSELQRRIQ